MSLNLMSKFIVTSLLHDPVSFARQSMPVALTASLSLAAGGPECPVHPCGRARTTE